MKVTGYKLREALRRWQLRRDTAAGQFEKSLAKFADEDKPTPQTITGSVMAAETAIASLQTAQTRYNVAVSVEVPEVGRVPLLYCVKAIGGLARVEKLWRGAATADKKNRSLLYGGTLSRDKDSEQAKPTVTPEEAANMAERYGRKLAALREAIATGNATELAIEDLDLALFE